MSTVARSFPQLFILIDSLWILALCAGLWALRRRQALLVGVLAGIIYILVDYGVFYLLLGTRVVTGGDPFWVLFWMSMSYGITNFAWIWLLLDRDKLAVEWSVAIVAAWFAVSLLAKNYGDPATMITTARGTGGYHGAMALILLVGYLILVVRNVRARARGGEGDALAPIPRLLAIGVGVQFAWEAALLITGVRPAGVFVIVENALIETNLGLPWAWMIHRAMAARWDRNMVRVRPRR